MACSCPESGCAFVGGSPAMLLEHFATGHQRPAVTVRYGQSSNLSFSLSHPCHVLVGEEDPSVFLVSVGPIGAATAVSLVCVRPGGEAAVAPRFWCKLSVERPGKDMVLMVTPVRSSTLATGAPAPGKGMFLAVPQELLSGDTITLSVWIDLIPSAAGAPNEVDYTTIGQEADEDAVKPWVDSSNKYVPADPVYSKDSGVPREPSDLYSSDDSVYIKLMEGPKKPSKKDNKEKNDYDDEEEEEEDDDDDDDQPKVSGKRPRRSDGPEQASKKKKD